MSELQRLDLGADALVRYLRHRDVACPRCGRNLKDVMSGRCPGCKEELRLGIGLADPFLKAWIVLAVALFLPAGVGAICIVILINEGWPPPRMILLTIAIIYFLLAIPLTFVAMLGRRRFLRLSRASQSAWSIAACGATVIAFVLFVLGLD